MGEVITGRFQEPPDDDLWDVYCAWGCGCPAKATIDKDNNILACCNCCGETYTGDEIE